MTTSIQSIARHPCYTEARAVCDRLEMDTEEDLMQVLGALAHKRFMQESEPWRAQIIKLHRFVRFTPDVTILGQRPELTAQEQEMVRDIEAIIAKIAEKYRVGGPPEGPPA